MNVIVVAIFMICCEGDGEQETEQCSKLLILYSNTLVVHVLYKTKTTWNDSYHIEAKLGKMPPPPACTSGGLLEYGFGCTREVSG